MEGGGKTAVQDARAIGHRLAMDGGEPVRTRPFAPGISRRAPHGLSAHKATGYEIDFRCSKTDKAC